MKLSPARSERLRTLKSILQFLLFACCLQAQSGRQVAITVDDLPTGGDSDCAAERVLKVNRKFLQPFRKDDLPLTGFVNEGRCADLGDLRLREILEIWLDAGAELGNHTYSHPDLNKTSMAAYQAAIVDGERLTKAALAARGRTLRYFRHPFLHAGPTREVKQALETFLKSRNYQIAPVTLDNSDWMFAWVYADAKLRNDTKLAQRVRQEYVSYLESTFDFFEKRSVELTGYEFPQILLIHVNELNADTMPDLLSMIKKRSYSIIPLEQALKDRTYRLEDAYAGPNGFSWIHRWSRTKGMAPKGEPSEPEWIRKAFARK